MTTTTNTHVTAAEIAPGLRYHVELPQTLIACLAHADTLCLEATETLAQLLHTIGAQATLAAHGRRDGTAATLPLIDELTETVTYRLIDGCRESIDAHWAQRDAGEPGEMAQAITWEVAHAELAELRQAAMEAAWRAAVEQRNSQAAA